MDLRDSFEVEAVSILLENATESFALTFKVNHLPLSREFPLNLAVLRHHDTNEGLDLAIDVIECATLTDLAFFIQSLDFHLGKDFIVPLQVFRRHLDFPIWAEHAMTLKVEVE